VERADAINIPSRSTELATSEIRPARALIQYLAAGLVDEFELHIVPTLLGDGERPLDNLGNVKLEQVRVLEAPGVAHLLGLATP
jgi:RibD C-terminal domain